MRVLSLVLLSYCCLCLPNCSSKKSIGSNTEACKASPAEGGCGTPCLTDVNACADGFFCSSSGVCDAECSLVNNIPCADASTCTSNGRCLAANSSNGDSGSDVCAEVHIDTDNITPNIVLIVDQSLSMDSNFGGNSRWDTLRNFLIGEQGSRPDGLIYDLQQSVRFGIALYSAMNDRAYVRKVDPGTDPNANGDSTLPHADTSCPLINFANSPEWSVSEDWNTQSPQAPALNAYNDIVSLYADANMVDDTPTGDAIEFLANYFKTNPIGNSDPIVFLLATDGEPDTCTALNQGASQAAANAGKSKALSAVAAAYDDGIRTYVVSVAADSDHFQDMANAGAGVDTNNGDADAPYYPVTDPAGLATALQTLVQNQLSCTFELQGNIKDLSKACEGQVVLTSNEDPNGTTLPCDDPNGWRAVDANHIELQGSACTDLKNGSNASLAGTFPCNVADSVF
ncbi:MAG: VWA domain-containing protein [Myxococcales bacterium]|nr:MAG: VWA domain-containing protein [Myxococcales bacterium]